MKSVASTSPVAAPAYKRRRYPVRPLLLLAVIIVAVGGYFAYDRFFKPQPVATTATKQQVAVARGTIVATVSATGSVAPAQTADLAFGTSGRLLELKASVGQNVKKGDVLARLDTTDLQVEVLKAEASLASAQSNLAKLQAGSTAGDIASARAQLKSAQATLDKTQTGATAVQLQSGEASVASARVSLQKAQTTLDDLKAGPDADTITNAQIALEKSKISKQNAQAAYDKISWRNDASATQEAMTLWQATTDYAAAEQTYKKAVAGPTPDDLNVAEQAVVSARAQLAVAEANLAELGQGATAAELASAEASVVQAQTNLETKLNPSTTAEIQASQASVEQAKVAVQSAKNNLDKATMSAPFDGVVATVAGTVGQTVTGTIVSLLDLSAPLLQISLPETDVAKVSVGQQAVITFDSLSSLQLTGKVATISPKATMSSGVATYAVTLSISNTPPSLQPAGTAATGQGGMAARAGQGAPVAQGTPGSQVQGGRPAAASPGQQLPAGAGAQTVDLSRLKVGMTGSVSIEYLRRDNVLVVPNGAIKAQGRNRAVEVLVGDTSETRIVALGAADDQRTEIQSGLQEGDQVVISSTSTTTSTANRGAQQGAFPGGGVPGGGGFIQGGAPIVPPGR